MLVCVCVCVCMALSVALLLAAVPGPVGFQSWPCLYRQRARRALGGSPPVCDVYVNLEIQPPCLAWDVGRCRAPVEQARAPSAGIAEVLPVSAAFFCFSCILACHWFPLRICFWEIQLKTQLELIETIVDSPTKRVMQPSEVMTYKYNYGFTKVCWKTQLTIRYIWYLMFVRKGWGQCYGLSVRVPLKSMC